MFGSAWEGFVEMVALDLGYRMWAELYQGAKGRKRWEDVSGRGTSVEPSCDKGHLWDIIVAKNRCHLVGVRDT